MSGTRLAHIDNLASGVRPSFYKHKVRPTAGIIDELSSMASSITKTIIQNSCEEVLESFHPSPW